MPYQNLSTYTGHDLRVVPKTYFQNGITFNETDLITHYEYLNPTPTLILRGTGTWTTAPTYTLQDAHFNHLGRTITWNIRLIWNNSPSASDGTDTVHLALPIAPQDSYEDFPTFISTGFDLNPNEVLYAITNDATQELDLYARNVNTGNIDQIEASRIQLGTLTLGGTYHDDTS